MEFDIWLGGWLDYDVVSECGELRDVAVGLSFDGDAGGAGVGVAMQPGYYAHDRVEPQREGDGNELGSH